MTPLTNPRKNKQTTQKQQKTIQKTTTNKKRKNEHKKKNTKKRKLGRHAKPWKIKYCWMIKRIEFGKCLMFE